MTGEVRWTLRILLWIAWISAWPAVSLAQWSSPLTCADCVGYFYYVDHGSVQDYTCGNETYSGHSGTDYSLRRGNQAIDDDNEVVAMAAGTVVKAEDGYYDRCSSCGGPNCGLGFGNGFANQVVITHGSQRVVYGHMKMGSIAVAQGDTVACGQVIGFVGSSGCSTGAHLHIEPAGPGGFGSGSVDPYVGPCSSATSSLFVDQGPYRGLPAMQCDMSGPTEGCPADIHEIWTCTEDGTLRRRCVAGVVSEEDCAWGCTAMATGVDDVCALPPDADGDGARGDVDCDDADAMRHAGALDVCGDAIDQDCSGADATCPVGAAAGMAPAPVGGASGAAGVGGMAGATTGTAGLASAAGMAAPYPYGTAGSAEQGYVRNLRRAPVATEGCHVASTGGAPPPPAMWQLAVLALALRTARSMRKRGGGARPGEV